MSLPKSLLIPALLALGLSGCVESRVHLSQDFGLAVRQNEVAQIADPDARYPADPIADGARVGLAQQRYRTGLTIPPATTSASEIGISSGPSK